MKNYFVSEKIDKLVILFKNVNCYKRVLNQNTNEFDRSEISVGGYACLLNGYEAERFDKEYMEWVEWQK